MIGLAVLDVGNSAAPRLLSIATIGVYQSDGTPLKIVDRRAPLRNCAKWSFGLTVRGGCIALYFIEYKDRQGMEEMSSQLDLLRVNPSGCKRIYQELADEMITVGPLLWRSAAANALDVDVMAEPA